MTLEPRPVLLDMDPGVDDALGILLAMASPEVEIVAAAGALPPVACGAYRPLLRTPFRAGGIHGTDGLGGVCDKYPNPAISELDPRPAVDVILDAVRQSNRVQRALTIVATGPLTNIAHAISKDSETMRSVDRVVWMGGAYTVPGNISAYGEFNAFCDPDAAAEVFAFGIPITAVGLDVCLQCPLTRADLKSIAGAGKGRATQFAWDISQMYMDFYRQAEGFDGCYLHDPLAIGLAIWPEFITRKEIHDIEVVTQPGPTWGMTVIDRRPRNPWNNTVWYAVKLMEGLALQTPRSCSRSAS